MRGSEVLQSSGVVLVLFFIILYMVVCFVYFFNSVGYVFLLLCIFCSVYSVFIVPTGILQLP
jgi:hypothetical protein